MLRYRRLATSVLAFGLAIPIALAAQSGAPTGTGIVLGQVVDAVSGQSIADAAVTLSRRSGGIGQGPVQPNRVLASADGRFVFTGLARGSISLSATAPGYESGIMGQAVPNGPARPLELAEGERRGEVKLRLWKHAAISGMVVDEAGEPAVGARVVALRRMSAATGVRFQPAGTATTDDRGIYRIGALTPAAYVVGTPHTQITAPAAAAEQFMQMVVGAASGARAAGAGVGMGDLVASGVGPAAMSGVRVGEFLFSTESIRPPAPAAGVRLHAYRTLFHPQTPDPNEAAPLQLRSGDERTGINLQLELVPTSMVSGMVTGPQGPLANVTVRLVPLRGGSPDRPGEYDSDTARTGTGADGVFTMLGVPPGRYVARVLRQPPPDLPEELASNPLMQMARGMMGGATTLMFGETDVTVGDADVEAIAIGVREGLKVAGRLEFDATAPPPAPEQLRSMQVSLSSVDRRLTNVAGAIRANEKGAFTTRPSPAGRYVVTVSGPVTARWTVKSMVSGGRDWMLQPIELVDRDVDDLVITFTTRVAMVSGTVRPAAAATTASVVLFPADYQSWIQHGLGDRQARRVVAGPSGAFSVERLLAGDYLVAAVDDTEIDMSDPAFFTALASRAARVTLRDGDTRSLDLAVVRIAR